MADEISVRCLFVCLCVWVRLQIENLWLVQAGNHAVVAFVSKRLMAIEQNIPELHAECDWLQKVIEMMNGTLANGNDEKHKEDVGLGNVNSERH